MPYAFLFHVSTFFSNSLRGRSQPGNLASQGPRASQAALQPGNLTRALVREISRLDSSFFFSGSEFDGPKGKRLPDGKTRILVVTKVKHSVLVRSAKWNLFSEPKAIERTPKVCEFDKNSDAVLVPSELAGKYFCGYASHRFCHLLTQIGPPVWRGNAR